MANSDQRIIPIASLTPNPLMLRNESLRGMACFALGMFLFTAVDTQAKFLTDTFHPVQVAWFRQLGLLVGVLILLGLRGPRLLKTDHPWLQIGRGAFAACSAVIFITAISVVPLADAIAVSFVAPFFVTVLGAIVLGEQVGPRRWTAIGIGFVACLIIIRPGMGVFHPAMFLIILAAAFYAGRQILSRMISGNDATATTVAYTALTASALLTLPLPLIWTTPVWGLQILLIMSVAITAAVAEVCVIRALELTQAVVLAPIHYTLLIWGTIYGWFVFGQLPDGWTWFGAAIITITGIYMVRREQRLAKMKSV